MNLLDQFRKDAGIIMPTVTVDENTVTYTKECKIIKAPYVVVITRLEQRRMNDGELTQNVLTHKTPDEREFIISGTTPAEWNDMFKEEEE